MNWPNPRQVDRSPLELISGDAFFKEFGVQPTHFARAPGRVNLIGEHIDYHDLPVFPMAIQRQVYLAFRCRDDGFVRIRSVSEDFEEVEFEIGREITANLPGHWGNYLKTPANELARRFAVSHGFDGVLVSDIPIARVLWASGYKDRYRSKPFCSQTFCGGFDNHPVILSIGLTLLDDLAFFTFPHSTKAPS